MSRAQATDGGKDSPGLKEPHHSVRLLQARQESNLQPPVLETSLRSPPKTRRLRKRPSKTEIDRAAFRPRPR